MAYRGNRIEVMGVDRNIMHISKKHYEAIHKKAFITKEYPVPGKLIIEYTGKRDDSKGVMELYDIGPKPTKLKEENDNGR